MRRLLIALGVALVTINVAWAEETDPIVEIMNTLHYQKGHIVLPSGVAAIDVPAGYTYLDAADSETFLTKVWENPPGAGEGVEGMLLPDKGDWAVVISYDNSGYVSDADSEKINYDELLSDMKQQAIDSNDARQKAGYPPVILIGWAEPPHYDKPAKTIYWAKRLRFGNDTAETLNYFIRVLGRGGVMDLDVVASVDQLADVQSHSPELLKAVSFNAGSTYADFKPGSDNVAAYGLAGLIAGGVLVKAGFLKGLLLLVAAFWKVIAVAFFAFVAALGSFFRRLFNRTPNGG